jgi:hypothetical protein
MIVDIYQQEAELHSRITLDEIREAAAEFFCSFH